MAGVGAVEDGEVGVALDALGHQENAAALVVIDGFEGVVLGEFPLARLWKRMRAGGREVEVAAEKKESVAQAFGVETAAGGGGEQLVVRVAGERLGAACRGEAVGAREEDLAVQGFDGPAAVAQFGGEVVEQFGMGGRLALFAEVIRRREIVVAPPSASGWM